MRKKKDNFLINQRKEKRNSFIYLHDIYIPNKKWKTIKIASWLGNQNTTVDDVDGTRKINICKFTKEKLNKQKKGEDSATFF